MGITPIGLGCTFLSPVFYRQIGIRTIKNGIAVILGAGGTAKAAAYTVQQLGLHPVRYVL